MGFLAEGPDAEKMARKMIAALRNFLQNEIQFEGLNFRDIQINPFNDGLSDLISEIGFRGIAGTVQVPKDYVLLSRTISSCLVCPIRWIRPITHLKRCGLLPRNIC